MLDGQHTHTGIPLKHLNMLSSEKLSSNPQQSSSIFLGEINSPFHHVGGEKGFPDSMMTWKIQIL